MSLDRAEATNHQDARKTEKSNAEPIVDENSPYRQAVGCVIHLGGSYLLVHKISTSDVRDADFQPSWDLLKGGIKKGECKEEALFREVEEELGLGPDSVRRTRFLDQTIDFDFPPGSNFKGQVTHMALVDLKEGSEAEVEIDQAELGAFRLCSFTDMVDLVAFPETRDFLSRNQAEIRAYFEGGPQEAEA